VSGDALVMGLGGRSLALDTSLVASIVETLVRHLPGRAGFIEGVISFRGEPVVVVDIWRAFSGPDAGGGRTGGARRVVVVREGGRTLGLDIGPAEISFLWRDGLEGAAEGSSSSASSSGVVSAGGGTVERIDWGKLFDEAAAILSAQRSGV
jgi:chemotaxis signal transduction protein